MVTFDFPGPPKAVLAQVFPGPGGPGIPEPPGPVKTCARTAMGTPKISKVIIFLDPYREFRTSPKRLWTPKNVGQNSYSGPRSPKIDQKRPPPPLGREGVPSFAVPIGRVLQKTPTIR